MLAYKNLKRTKTKLFKVKASVIKGRPHLVDYSISNMRDYPSKDTNHRVDGRVAVLYSNSHHTFSDIRYIHGISSSNRPNLSSMLPYNDRHYCHGVGLFTFKVTPCASPRRWFVCVRALDHGSESIFGTLTYRVLSGYPISLISQNQTCLPAYNQPPWPDDPGKARPGKLFVALCPSSCNKTIWMPSESPERAIHHMVIVSKELLTRSRRIGGLLRRPKAVTSQSLWSKKRGLERLTRAIACNASLAKLRTQPTKPYHLKLKVRAKVKKRSAFLVRGRGLGRDFGEECR